MFSSVILVDMIDWIEHFFTWDSWLKGLAAIGGAATGVAALWKLFTFSTKHIRKVNATLGGFVEIIPILTKLAEEFKPNGGSSLRDAIDRLEKKSSLSEQRIRALISYSDIPCFESDAKGQCVWVSKKWCEFAGISMEEAHGNGWVVALPEHERDRVFEEWQSAIEQQREFVLTYDFGINKPIKVKTVATVIRDKKDNIISFFGTLIPVTKTNKGV